MDLVSSSVALAVQYTTSQENIILSNKMSTSISTSTSTVIKDGKRVITKTVTKTGPDGKTTTKTFVEEHKDDNSGHLDPDFFKMRIKNFKDAEKNDTTDDGNTDDCKSPVEIKDGKMMITKTVTRTGPEGKTTTETFFEEHKDNNSGHL